MTLPVLLFSYRKPGLSPTDVRSHYESIHVLLLQSIAGSHFPKIHGRCYIYRSEGEDSESLETSSYPAAVLMRAQADLEYDAIAELTFGDEAAFETFRDIVSDEEAADRIAKDEEMFLDRGRLKIVVGGERAFTEGQSTSQ